MVLKREKIDEIVDYFKFLSKRDQRILTNKKLQKLLYYAQAWHLVFREKESMFSNKIEAWVHGPVVPYIYHQYKHQGFTNIVSKNFDIQINELRLDKQDKDLLDDVWRVYGKHDADYLEILTHKETPWIEAREGLEVYEGSSNEVSLDVMFSYYQSLLEQSKK